MGCTILLWDHLLTFGDEIQYIWKRPVELTKAVFLFNRYFVEGVMCLSAYGEFEDYLTYRGGSYLGVTVLLDLRGPLSQEVS